MKNFLKFYFKVLYLIKRILIVVKYLILNFNIINLYLFFLIIFFIFNKIFLKKFFNSIYKDNKFNNFLILNISFFLLLFLALDLKNNIHFFLKKIYIKVGSEKLYAINLLSSSLWIVVTIFISFYNGIIFEILFEDIEEIDLNLRILIFKVFSLLLFFLILITGFTFLNLDNLILTIIGGAFSLGLSLSVQKIITNYISGLIILTDKSFKIGDAINLNGFQGVMTQVTNRHVMLRNLDCSEILIPNEKFINDIVQNQSLYFSKGNLRINIQISYNNDVKLVLKLLTESTRHIDRVLDNPPSLSYFTNFNINSIELELSFWITDALRGAAIVRSNVNLNIHENFIENKIELAYVKKYIKIFN